MSDLNRDVASASAKIAADALKRCIEDEPHGPDRTYLMALVVAVDLAALRRPPAESVFMSLVASAVVDGIAGDVMPALRSSIAQRCLGGRRAAKDPSLN